MTTGKTSEEIKNRKDNFKQKSNIYRKTEAFRVVMTFAYNIMQPRRATYK